ncbi:MAG: hypothetical protein KME60_21430 [Cyanomargarita calcarea GSE-NOS-MK-12-04C]|jgi:hypothetical protein|uniref:Uncharacterized protein n=1 Tax=Cyanomargarita calcarea GSE-NOS-MK-12-04C TaxID=2839659 RepID=A0A951QQQ6_9CYAN|nr:hypothetical protein [Cyanomargarita calcarea GSE-NOS-MK-12-04C]
MGAEPYFYFVEYQPNINAALEALREGEFRAGRYNPVIPFLDFPINPNSPKPGAKHSSIEMAIKAANADGTRSIIDIYRVSEFPFPHNKLQSLNDVQAIYEEMKILFHTTFPLTTSELLNLFGTDEPTHEMVESIIIEELGPVAFDFWDSIERGTSKHIVLYEESQPSEIFFAGYSFD